MDEYIKRDDALRELEKINPVDYGAMWNYGAHHYVGECLRDCKEALCELSSADVAPVVHGRWDILDGYKTRRVCSACGWDVPEYGKFYSYCPNCGARMDGDKE